MTQNQIAYWNLQETKRSNAAREQETNRSNLMQEQLKLGSLEETQRSNRAKETETNRANLVNEQLKQSQIESENKRREVQNVTDSVKAGVEVAKSAVSLANLFI